MKETKVKEENVKEEKIEEKVKEEKVKEEKVKEEKVKEEKQSQGMYGRQSSVALSLPRILSAWLAMFHLALSLSCF